MPIPTTAILQHLDLQPQSPTLAFLNQILAAWSARIPWESVSRIARHQSPGTPNNHARFPSTFFTDALQHGTGGTCFESNFALHNLLNELGFQATLHFCDMQDSSTTDPHSANITVIDGQRFLTDTGYPIPGALELNPHTTTTVSTPAYHFRAIPQPHNCWEIRRRADDYESYSFTVKTDPIPADVFRARLLHDHQPDGLFLGEIIISRTDSSGMLRFSQDKGLVKRTLHGEKPVPLSPNQQANLPATLGQLFSITPSIIATAFNHHTPPGKNDVK